MKDLVDKIEYLHKYLVNVHLSFSQGSKKISLHLTEEMLSEIEESEYYLLLKLRPGIFN